MASVGVPDAKGLEGRREGHNSAPQSRDFFWDSITLFLVTAILALTAIDVVSEYVRGSEVQCFLPNGSLPDNVRDYVNEKCAASLPAAEYLPGFIALHAILILAPHYIWLNLFGANLDFFFHQASAIVRSRDPTTGDYPRNNYLISKQLQDAFAGGSNSMYIRYLLKLLIQLLLSIGGFALVLWLFVDFNDTFMCPSVLDDTISKDWPLTYQRVVCVFTSLRLLHKIWIIYLVLLGLVIICLFVAFISLLKDHTTELGIKCDADFSFQTSLPFHYYRPQFQMARRVLLYIPSFLCSSREYRIRSDYDFLLIKLFRTDGGLAYILREIHALQLLKDENDTELARIRIHLTQLRLKGEVSTDHKFLFSDLKWKVCRRIQCHKPFARSRCLTLPPCIRGVVLGFSALCNGSNVIYKPPRVSSKQLCGALCIVFDSESLGFAGALARVFYRVAVINFSRCYSDYERPIYLNVNSSSQIVSITTPHDILVTDREVIINKEDKRKANDKFYDDLNEVWRPDYIYRSEQDSIKYQSEGKPETFDFSKDKLETYPTDYIIVGPMTNHLQVATVNMLMDRVGPQNDEPDEFNLISRGAVLVTITPQEISGVTVEGPFHDVKISDFVKFPVYARIQTRSHEWFPEGVEKTIETKRSYFDWNVKAGASESKFRFSIYQHNSSSTGSTTGSGRTAQTNYS